MTYIQNIKNRCDLWKRFGETFPSQVVHKRGAKRSLVKQLVGKGVSKYKKRTAQKLPSVYIKARQKVAKVWNISI